MNCPVCQQPDISSETSTCPHCGSDLEFFGVINQLDDTLRQRKKNFMLMTMLAVLLAATLGVALYMNQNSASAKNGKELQSLKTENDSLKKEVQKLSVMPVPPTTMKEKSEKKETSAEFTTHTVKKGESLWMISKKYWGDGSKYPKIASDNSLSNPNVLEVGQELKVYTAKK